MPVLRFRVHRQQWAVVRLAPGSAVPEWASHGALTSVTRTPSELSIVCPQEHVPPDTLAEKDWSCLELQGPIPFNLTGVLHAFLTPLAAAGIPIFALSTYDTDWVLIPAAKYQSALAALTAAGHEAIHG